MSDLDPNLFLGALAKVTILLAAVLALALILRGLEPRWRVLLVRGAILATPVILIADFLEPQLHLKARAQEQLLVLRNLNSISSPPAAAEIAPAAIELETAPAPPGVLTKPQNAGPVPRRSAFQIPWTAWALAAWIAIAGILTLREFLRLRKVSRESKTWTDPDRRVAAGWRQVCGEMGIRETRLRVAAGPNSPFLKPGFRSTLVIPEGLTEPERLGLLGHVFRHEAAHLKNHDAFWIPAVRILSCLVWFHPLAWWLAALHLKACEEASDAEAARHGGTDSYRGALARLALDLVPVRAPAATFLRLPGVLSRIRAIPKHANRRPPKRWIAAVVALTLAGAGGLLGTIGFAQEEGAEPTGPIADKLKSIVIPEIEFVDTPIADVFAFLRLKSVELDAAEPDPAKKGINVIVVGEARSAGPVTLQLRNSTLGDAVRYVCEKAGVGARIDEHALAIVGPDAGIHVPVSKPNGAIERKLKEIIIPEVEFDETPLSQAIEFIRVKSIELDDAEPDPKFKGGNLVILAPSAAADPPISLRLTNAPLGEVLRYTAALASCQLRIDGGAIAIVPAEDEASAEKHVDLAAGGLAAKLNTIVIPAVEFNETPLNQAIEFLRSKSVELDNEEPDPSKKGVNLILGPGVDGSRKLTLRLTRIPLGEALKYVAELTRNQVEVEPAAVVLKKAVNDGGRANRDLFTKAFAVNANARAALKGKDAKTALEAEGVEFPPGASAIFNPATSQLVIRNTSDNLKLVEAWLNQKERGGGASAAPKPSSPEDIWLQAYLLMRQAEELVETDRLGALGTYQESQRHFDFIAARFPQWKPEMVEFRRKKLAGQIDQLRAGFEKDPTPGLLSESLLKIRGASTERLSDEEGNLRITLHLEIQCDEPHRIDLKKMVVDVRFFEVVRDEALQPYLGETKMRPPSAPYDWKDGVKAVAFQYRLSAEEAEADERRYFGYIAELTYDGVLQYVVASPSNLSGWSTDSIPAKTNRRRFSESSHGIG